MDSSGIPIQRDSALCGNRKKFRFGVFHLGFSTSNVSGTLFLFQPQPRFTWELVDEPIEIRLENVIPQPQPQPQPQPEREPEPISESPLWERRTDTPRSPPPEECSGNVFRANGHHRNEFRSCDNSHPHSHYTPYGSDDRSHRRRADRDEVGECTRHERPGSRGSSRSSGSSGRYQRECHASRYHRYGEHYRTGLDEARLYARNTAQHRYKSNYTSVTSDAKMHSAEAGSADKYTRARDTRSSSASSGSHHRRDFRNSSSSTPGSDFERPAYKSPYEEYRGRGYSDTDYHDKQQHDNYYRSSGGRYNYSSDRSQKKYGDDQDEFEVDETGKSSSKSKHVGRHSVRLLHPFLAAIQWQALN